MTEELPHVDRKRHQILFSAANPFEWLFFIGHDRLYMKRYIAQASQVQSHQVRSSQSNVALFSLDAGFPDQLAVFFQFRAHERAEVSGVSPTLSLPS
jgi:hypothetical protein